MDMSRFAQQNSGTRYILVFFDVVSRKLYAEIMPNKTGAATLDAIKNIFSRVTSLPKKLQFDKGYLTCQCPSLKETLFLPPGI